METHQNEITLCRKYLSSCSKGHHSELASLVRKSFLTCATYKGKNLLPGEQVFLSLREVPILPMK